MERGALWALGASSLLHEIGIEFVSAKFIFEFYSGQKADPLEIGIPEVGLTYGLVGLVYLAILVYVLWRFRYVAELRQGLSEARQKRQRARQAKAERKRRLAEARAQVQGVSYEAFEALRMANQAFDLGLFEEALKSYDEAVRASPPLSAAWVGRGAALGRLGRHQEAKASFLKALEISPANQEALVNLGLTDLALGRKEEARQAFEQALSIDEGYGRAHLGLALLDASSGKEKEAKERLKHAFKLSPALRKEASCHSLLAPLLEPAEEALARKHPNHT